MRRIALLLAMLLSAAAVATAQTPVVTKAVDDATKATTDVGDATNKAVRASIWFTGTNIDPRDVSDRIARQVGRLVLINSSNVEIGTSASPLYVSPASGASFAVTGTFWQGTQPVSGPLTDTQLRAAAVPVSGTFWQATQPISAASLPLPSGAATAAKQPALGIAGTASADVLTVQGIASMTALKVDGSATTQPVSGTFWQATQPVSGTFWQATQPVSGTITANIGTSGSLALDASVTGLQVAQASTTSGQKGALALGAVTIAAPTYTTAQSNPLSLTTSGALRTDASATTQPVSGSVTVSGTVTANAGTGNFTVTQATGSNLHAVLDAGAATIGALTANQSVNLAQVAGVTTSTSLGIADTGTQRVALTQEATYSASTTLKTATAAGTAAFFELCGSGTKTIRLQRVMVSGTVATAAVYGDLQIRKNSAAATGGTATTLTNTPYDSNSAAATATAKYFTVLPTGGATLVGNIMSETAFFPITGTVATMTPQLIYVWRDTDAEAPTLRGAAQCVTAGFGTTTTNAPTLSVSVAWTEK